MKILAGLLFITFISFSSCTKKDSCPSDVKLGSLSLISSSRPFLPYNNLNYLYFINKDTMFVDSIMKDSVFINQAILQSFQGLIEDSSRTITGNICLIEKERSDSFYISEHKTVDFLDIDTSRKFRVFGNLTITEDFRSKFSFWPDFVLYDELKLTVHRGNPSLSGAVATIEFVANDRGNQSRMSDSLISKINRYKLVADTTITDVTLHNVYEVSNNDSIYYYFKPYTGVVAFRDLNNKWWFRQ